MSRNRITAGPKSVVCQETDLRGEISIGAGTNDQEMEIVALEFTGIVIPGSILHPQCRVIAENGPIYIGRNNIIEENVIIFNNHSTPLIIGDGNAFEVGSYIEGSPIGNNNIVEARARVIGNTTVGNHCVIGAGCSTDANEKIVDYTVIYGGQSKRRTQSEVLPAQASLHARHLEYLREVLPKYNHLKKLDTM